MKLSHSVVYALQAVIALAEIGGDMPVSSRQIADRGKMPERYLLQILRGLVANGILQSSFGVSGGYSLTRPPQEITILEVLDAFESPITALSVPDLPGLAHIRRKQLVDCLTESVNAARQSLAKCTLADFVLLRSEVLGKSISGLAG